MRGFTVARELLSWLLWPVQCAKRSVTSDYPGLGGPGSWVENQWENKVGNDVEQILKNWLVCTGKVGTERVVNSKLIFPNKRLTTITIN